MTIVKPDRVISKVATICLAIIWIFIIAGYVIVYVVYTNHGVDMSFGMIVFLIPGIIVAIIYIIVQIYKGFRPQVDII